MASGLLPGQKMEELDRLSELTKGRTAFVGDGINDAPVLRQADVGIAIGGLGSDAAVEAADLVIMTDELERLPDAVAIARLTKRRVQENLVIILLTKGLLMALGAMGITPLWGAVFADTGVMLIAVLNSLRAYYGRVPR
jgi:Cd2+/Zn2+-exporting ATPase